MRRSWMTMIATIAAAVSFGSRRPMKSTFRPDFDSDGLQIIWDREFGFLKETLVAPVPRVAIMLDRTFGEATAATLHQAFPGGPCTPAIPLAPAIRPTVARRPIEASKPRSTTSALRKERAFPNGLANGQVDPLQTLPLVQKR
jgi:hypothetical protein